MATCIVTGGAGFLGSHLCDHLLARGHRVICVDNLDTGSLQNLQHIRSPEFEFVQHDLTEPLFVDEPIEFVYHLASPASPIDYLRLPLHTLKVGSYGTHHMLGLAKKHRARFVLASTSEVYGDPQVHPQPESYWGHVNPIGPRGVYDEAKRYAEALTMAYHRQQGVDTGIVRTFNSFGSRMRPSRRPRDPDLPAPGASGQAADRVRRRQPDAQLLLRRRPDSRLYRDGGMRRPRPGQRRQPG
jgi:dTDP-glucose 4,6-dehydratase